MISYLLFISVIGLFAFIESSGFNDGGINKYKVYLKYVAFTMLLIFVGLRYKVGADWLQYYTYYGNLETLGTVLFNAKNAPYFYEHPWEPAFKLLCMLAKSLSMPFEGVVFLITAFNLYSLNKFLKQHLKSEMCVFLLLFLSLNMLREFDILRQSIAFYVLLFSYKYINKSFFKFLLVCVAACLFHTSAIIFVLVYPLFKLKVRRGFLTATLGLFVLSLILKLRILSMLVDLADKLLPVSSATFLLHQIKLYLAFYPLQSNINLVTLLSLFFLAILIIYYKKVSFFDQKFVVSFVIFIYISILLSEVGEVQSRFGYFFSTGLVYCAAGFVYLFKRYKDVIHPLFIGVRQHKDCFAV